MIYSSTKEDFRKFSLPEDFEKIVEISNIGDLLNHVKNHYLGLEAMVKEDGSVATYDELLNDIKRGINLLESNQVSKGSNVGVLFPNTYSFMVSALAIMAYGCCAVLIPAHLDEKVVFGCSKKYVLKSLIYADCFLDKVSLINPQETLLLAQKQLFEYEPASIDSFTSLDPLSNACVIMTGGTSGRSKGALLSQQALLKGTINGCYGIHHFMHLRYYCLLPLTHVFGFIRNAMNSIYTGSVIMFNADKKAMFNEMQKFQPTILVLVPALAELFLNLTRAYGKEMLGGKFETIICGAATVPPYLVEEYQKIGITLLPGYGLTESANLVSGCPTPLEYPNSVGLLYPDQEAKVVNGELYLRGTNIISQYFNEPEENVTAFEDGWFKTGDLVRFDEHNNLYIIGRSKDVIVLSNGENVSPAYIESKINELDFIQDSLVTEDRSDLGSHILQVEVVLRPAVIKTLGKQGEELKKFVEQEIEKVNQKLLNYERVSRVIIRDKDFERTPAMKIIRPKKVF